MGMYNAFSFPWAIVLTSVAGAIIGRIEADIATTKIVMITNTVRNNGATVNIHATCIL